PVLTVTLTAPLEGIIGVLIEHHTGGLPHEGFDLPGIGDGSASPRIVIDAAGGAITSGELTARVRQGAGWSLSFEGGGHVLTSSEESSIA
ncbi:hypothetical protein SB773_32250, partial [Bacillus sp. SIMBA_074]|uniref:hypothetical protein n=1 Tax=Bacillus sp. SIMBA_074 TaxID=3085812 RepID=UPI00397C9303